MRQAFVGENLRGRIGLGQTIPIGCGVAHVVNLDGFPVEGIPFQIVTSGDVYAYTWTPTLKGFWQIEIHLMPPNPIPSIILVEEFEVRNPPPTQASAYFYDKVADEQGRGVQGVQVKVFPPGMTAPALFETLTDRYGNYSIPLSALQGLTVVDIYYSGSNIRPFERKAMALPS